MTAAREPVWLRPAFPIAAALALLTLLAWSYLFWLRAAMMAPSPDMPSMSVAEMAAMAAPGFAPWSAGHFFFMFGMWAVMMTGMMLPSVTPMLLLYARLARAMPFSSTAWFAAGYLMAWTGFSLAATLAQFGLERLALLTPMMASAGPIFGGGLLVAAGLYQWTPLKDTCLAQCRAPLSFVQRHGGFGGGRRRAARLGLLHGLYCVGCCWALMALLFLGGVMNILWIAGLMIFVLAEKIMPGGRTLPRMAGALAAATGLWLLAASS